MGSLDTDAQCKDQQALVGLVRFLDAQQGLRRAALQRDARQTATETQRSERCGSVRMQLNVPVTLALWYMGKRDKEISSRVRNVCVSRRLHRAGHLRRSAGSSEGTKGSIDTYCPQTGSKDVATTMFEFGVELLRQDFKARFHGTHVMFLRHNFS